MKYAIEDTTLTGIADAIREMTGSTNYFRANDFAKQIRNIGNGGTAKAEDISEGKTAYIKAVCYMQC